MTRQQIEAAIEQIKRDEFRLLHNQCHDRVIDLARIADDIAPDLAPEIRALELAKRQEVFERVKTHLLAQRRRSTKGNTLICAYRGDHGRQCAVGCLISEEKYHPSFEGSAAFLLVGRNLPLERYAFSPAFLDDLTDLQDIHDNKEPHHWATLLDAYEFRCLADASL